MSITTAASGSQLTVIGTEHTLTDIATPGDYQLFVNLTPAQAGDMVELRARVKVLATDAAPLGAWLGRFADQQPDDEAVAVSQAVTTSLSAAASIRFTLKQTAGSARTFDWRVDKIG